VCTDDALIRLSLHGSPEAFVDVVQRHEVAVYKFLARRAGHQAADDLLGEVWVRALTARGGYDSARACALPWLYGIARNVLRAHWRQTTTAGAEVADPAVDPWDDVVDRLDSAAEARTVLSAVRELPPAEREVLLLVAWEGLTPAEAAAALGVPQGTARSRLHRARTALRRALLLGRDVTAREGT
jgi:RNA polymerase sigma-70 factor (ECF subfamily)